MGPFGGMYWEDSCVLQENYAQALAGRAPDPASLRSISSPTAGRQVATHRDSKGLDFQRSKLFDLGFGLAVKMGWWVGLCSCTPTFQWGPFGGGPGGSAERPAGVKVSMQAKVTGPADRHSPTTYNYRLRIL